MIKFTIFLLLALLCGPTYISAKGQTSLGKEEKNQELIWVEHKQTPIHSVGQNVTYEFVFDGSDRNVERITQILYDEDMVGFTLFCIKM